MEKLEEIWEKYDRRDLFISQYLEMEKDTQKILWWLDSEIEIYLKDYNVKEIYIFTKSIIWFCQTIFHEPEDIHLRNIKEIVIPKFDTISYLDKIMLIGNINEAYKYNKMNEINTLSDKIFNEFNMDKISEDFMILENHTIFRDVGNLITSNDPENYESDLEEFTQLIDSNLDIYRYIQFIDFYYSEFLKVISEEDIKKLILKIFSIKNFENYKELNIKFPIEFGRTIEYFKVYIIYKKIIKTLVYLNN